MRIRTWGVISICAGLLLLAPLAVTAAVLAAQHTVLFVIAPSVALRALALVAGALLLFCVGVQLLRADRKRSGPRKV